jgi:metal-dependent amidase/aminoacylase/carboxypeptidase family protein
VVTVGSFQAGTTHNIISDEAKLLLTVRSYNEKTRRMLLDGIARIARGEAIAAGMPDDRMPVVTFRPNYTPATVNSEKITADTVALFTDRFGSDRVRRVPPPMVGEDFGRYVIAGTGCAKPDLLGRRRAAGQVGRQPAGTCPSSRRCTAHSGRRTRNAPSPPQRKR